MFCLPCDRPLFRTVNALTFEKEIFGKNFYFKFLRNVDVAAAITVDGHIVNPHIGLLSGGNLVIIELVFPKPETCSERGNTIARSRKLLLLSLPSGQIRRQRKEKP